MFSWVLAVGGWAASLEGPQGASLGKDLKEILGMRGGLQAWARREEAGRQQEGRAQAEGVAGPGAMLSVSLTWLGYLVWAFPSLIYSSST